MAGTQVSHSRLRNIDWNIWKTDDGMYLDSSVTRAIMMDIREELRRMNNVLHCSNCLDIPNVLRKIEKNTRKKKPLRKKT